MEKGRTFEEMQIISNYFFQNIKNHHLFEIEHKVSQKINVIIENSPELSRSQVVEILQLFNLKDDEHYGGSGWHDYQLHLSSLLRINGFKVKLVGKQLKLISRFWAFLY